MACQAERNIVHSAVKNNGMALQFASREMINDKYVVVTAVKQNPDSLK